MTLYRANYSLVARDGRVKVDEQWVFLKPKPILTLWKIPGLLEAMWECCEFQLEVWGLMPDNQIVDLSMDMEIDSPGSGVSLRSVIPLVLPFILMSNVMAGRCLLSLRPGWPV
jgi:hypothetical protein